VVVTRFGEVISAEVSNNGTQMNCSGGPMPWGSWVTCEETINGPDVGNDFSGGNNALLQRKHGYIYEVPAREHGSGAVSPMRSVGRFAHESVAYDQITNALFMTEDDFNFPSGFYRYQPPTGQCRSGSTTAAGCRCWPCAGSPTSTFPGTSRSAPRSTWSGWTSTTPIRFPAGTTNDQAIVAVANQGLANGAAMFSRLEGSIWDAGVVYFTSTQGGAPDPTIPVLAGFGDGRGQIWAYHVVAQRLRLMYESTGLDVLDLPDNVAISNRGTLVLCEDGLDNANFLRGLTQDGVLFDFAMNAIPGLQEEFAGACFAPDGRTLFVNMQDPGITFAIWGPWQREASAAPTSRSLPVL
jgi:secreted PhoX family phosphatase